MGRLKQIVILISMVLLLVGMTSWLGGKWLDEQLSMSRQFNDQVFEIAKGDTLGEFAAKLQTQGVVSEPYSLSLFGRYTGLAGKLHTGFYEFKDGLDLREVLEAITTGKYRLRHTFTFVQGSTFKQLRESLRQAKTLKQTLGEISDLEVLALFDTDARYTHAEGLFFPETYAYHPGDSDKDILQRAYSAMQSNLSSLWDSRADKLEITSPYEALILASIIEKETGLAKERSLIAGVFMNRLRKEMRLQTDPTVIYGMGDQYDGNITRKDLKTDTAYNTYTRYGLPPTPISMPGHAAIKAALNPATTDAIFFVAKGDGSRGHRFSTTLSAHNRAVKKFLKARRKSG